MTLSLTKVESSLFPSWQGRTRYVVLQCGLDAGSVWLQSFLQNWSALQTDAQAPQQLHYLIIAAQVPSRQQLHTALQDHPLAAELVSAWPAQLPGYQRVLLAQGRLVLTLIVSELVQALSQLEAKVDLFLLPDNPYWQLPQLKRLARMASPQARLLSTAALTISPDTLTQSGFVYTDASCQQALYAPRWQSAAEVAPQPERHAIVIGAGLAGSAVCESLCQRGWQVTLIEQHSGAAQEASGNLSGVYMPAVSRDDNPTARLTRSAFLFAHQVWQRIGLFAAERGAGQACGVLQVARDAGQAAAFEQAAQYWQYPPEYAQYLSADEASSRLGASTGSGWFFPKAGWLRPAIVCETMLSACGSGLVRRFGRAAAALQYQAQEQQWQVCDSKGDILAQAGVVIVANSLAATRLTQTASLPLQAIRGQVSYLPAALLPNLPCALSGDGYLTGAVDGLVSMGASYDQDSDSALRIDSHLGNLDKLQQMLPQLALQNESVPMQGRVGFRCVSADRLPLVGSLPDMAALASQGEVQRKNLARLPQLYAALAYASRGLIWAPLAAEILACQLEGEPAPLSEDLLALLDPARFALKQHRRR